MLQYISLIYYKIQVKKQIYYLYLKAYEIELDYSKAVLIKYKLKHPYYLIFYCNFQNSFAGLLPSGTCGYALLHPVPACTAVVLIPAHQQQRYPRHNQQSV